MILINDLQIKHIFDYSQSASQILMKFGSYMHLSKFSKDCY